jgi:hypothetical protein
MRRVLIFVAAMAIGMSGACAQVIPTDHLPMVPWTQGIIGGGTLSCAQATTYLARTTGGNEGGNAANISNLICGLVIDTVITGNMSTTGCGTTLDVFNIYAQQNSADALLNLCGTNYTSVPQSSEAGNFTAFRGYGAFNITGGNSLLTNFNSTTATSPNYTQNSAIFGFWSVANGSLPANSSMGTGNTGLTGESNTYNAFTGNLFYCRVNQGTSGSVPNPGTNGLYSCERTSSTNIFPYWDGSAQTAQTSTSQAPLNANFVVGSGGTGTGTDQVIAEAHIGAALGATLNLALYNRLRTYMTSVGVP